MKKVKSIALLLALVMVFGLAGCGASETGESPYTGNWTCTGYESEGYQMTTSDLGSSSLNLKSNGKADIVLMGESASCKWEETENGITISDSGDEYTGSMDNGALVIDFGGIDTYFEKDGGFTGSTGTQSDEKAVVADTQSDENSGADLMDYWNGDWYGWWGVDSASGSYEDMEGGWWDCCATIDIDENGEGEIDLWDEDYSADDLSGCVFISVGKTSASGDMGIAESESGWFMDDDIEEGEWIIDPSVSYYDDLLEIDGYYEDPDDDESYIYYVIYLRPWGLVWDDLKADDPDSLPYYYDDWYLPLVEAGKSMPDTIG